MSKHVLMNDDCMNAMKSLPDNSIDSIVTDPPYGLSFMGKKWDYDVPSVEVWKECLRVLKPGGHLLAFAGTRTQHRMAVNIEDAGFEIRDMIAWVYGSGFPKSMDVSKAIDKAAGAEREVIGSKTFADGSSARKTQKLGGNSTFSDPVSRESNLTITAPSTDEAKQWSGWGTALKPALEPITVARKPLIGTVANNVIEYGTGGINIDGCRVEVSDGDKGGWRPNCYESEYKYDDEGQFLGQFLNRGIAKQNPIGRFPANLIHDGSDEVGECFPQTKSGKDNKRKKDHQTGSMSGTLGMLDREEVSYGDSGSASRFFYCAKTSKSERNRGLDDLEDRVLARSCQAIAEAQRGNVCEQSDGAFNKARIVKNNHPTVKPIDLMKYLCRLVTRPNGVVLDPFMGSGSTGIAAMLEGFKFIGIEMDAEYFKIAEKRIDAYRTHI